MCATPLGQRDWWNGQPGRISQRRFLSCPDHYAKSRPTSCSPSRWPSASPSRCRTPASTRCSVRSLRSRRCSSSRSPRTPRGKRRELWGSFGLNRSGKQMWAFALVVPMLLAASAYARRARRGRRRPAGVRPHGVRRRLVDPEPRRHAGVHVGALPRRGDRLARLHAAAGPAAHQPPPSRRASPGSSTAASTCR